MNTLHTTSAPISQTITHSTIYDTTRIGGFVAFLLFVVGFSILTTIPLRVEGATTIKTATTSSSLVGWWTFDDASSTTATDFSGNRAHAIFSGAPLWVTGKRGGALDFDGVDDYLITPLSRSSYSSMTASAWFKYEGSVTDGYRAIFAGQSADFFVGKPDD